MSNEFRLEDGSNLSAACALIFAFPGGWCWDGTAWVDTASVSAAQLVAGVAQGTKELTNDGTWLGDWLFSLPAPPPAGTKYCKGKVFAASSPILVGNVFQFSGTTTEYVPSQEKRCPVLADVLDTFEELRCEWIVNNQYTNADVVNGVPQVFAQIVAEDCGKVIVPPGTPFTQIGVGMYVFAPHCLIPGAVYICTRTVYYLGQKHELEERKRAGYRSIVPLDTILLDLELYKPKEKELLWLKKMQPAIERLIMKHIGFDPIISERTEYMPVSYGYRRQDPFVRDFDVRGNRVMTEFGGPAEGAEQIAMPRVPIRAIHRLWENPMAFGGQAPGDFGDAYELFQGQDFWIDWTEWAHGKSGILYRIYMHWPVRPRTVKVCYTAGYTPEEIREGIAADLTLAVTKSVQYYWWCRGPSYPVETSESLGGYSRSFGGVTAGKLPREALKILSSWLSYERLL
jgi:hypothetical protein